MRVLLTLALALGLAAAARAAQMAKDTGMLVAVGFGVKAPEDVAKLAPHADGVVVGSAIVRTIEAASNRGEAVSNVGGLVESLAGALGR